MERLCCLSATLLFCSSLPTRYLYFCIFVFLYFGILYFLKCLQWKAVSHPPVWQQFTHKVKLAAVSEETAITIRYIVITIIIMVVMVTMIVLAVKLRVK